MQVSPLQLKQHFLAKISVDQRDKDFSEPAYGPCDFSSVEVVASIEHGVAKDEVKDPRNFILRLGLTFDKERKAKVPYDICIELVGFFEVASSVEKSRRAALVMANGAAILYSAAREAIVGVTGRFAKGHIVLPSVNFVDDADKMEREQKEKAALEEVEATSKQRSESRGSEKQEAANGEK